MRSSACSATGTRPSRDRAYADRMAESRAHLPDDDEAAAFYALALLATIPPDAARSGRVAEGRRDRGGDPQEEPAASGRRALRAPRVRRWRACGDGARGRADLRAHRAGVEPRAPHAVACVPAARHVGRGGRVRRIGVRGVGRMGQTARRFAGAGGFPQPLMAALRVPAAGQVRESARVARTSQSSA